MPLPRQPADALQPQLHAAVHGQGAPHRRQHAVRGAAPVRQRRRHGLRARVQASERASNLQNVRCCANSDTYVDVSVQPACKAQFLSKERLTIKADYPISGLRTVYADLNIGTRQKLTLELPRYFIGDPCKRAPL